MLRPVARAAPPGFPPDVAPNQIIYAAHINAIRDSVAVWPGNVDGNGKNLSNVATITATGAVNAGSANVTGLVTAGQVNVQHTVPALFLVDIDAPINSKYWRFTADVDTFYGQVFSDAQIFGGSWLEVRRSGNSVSSVAFPVRTYVALGVAPPVADQTGALQVAVPASGHVGSHISMIRVGVGATSLGYKQSSDRFGFGAATAGAFDPGYWSIDLADYYRMQFYAPPVAPSDAVLANGQITLYVDQGANLLKIRVRYWDGTLKTGQITLS